MDNEIYIVGVIQPDVGSGHLHFQDRIYHSGGIARSITARDYKDSMKVLVYERKRHNSIGLSSQSNNINS